MRMILALAAAFAACLTALPASAQTETQNTPRPYVGVVGGYESFKDDGPKGALVGVIGGIDYDLGQTPIFVGVEANGMAGTGSIGSEYGVAGVVGTRAHLGGTWKLFAKAGPQRVEFKHAGGATKLLAGVGADYAPFASRPGFALRADIDTLSFDTVRATGGIVLRFNSF